MWSKTVFRAWYISWSLNPFFFTFRFFNLGSCKFVLIHKINAFPRVLIRSRTLLPKDAMTQGFFFSFSLEPCRPELGSVSWVFFPYLQRKGAWRRSGGGGGGILILKRRFSLCRLTVQLLFTVSLRYVELPCNSIWSVFLSSILRYPPGSNGGPRVWWRWCVP